ncbi:MAG: aminomethyltransferase, partial [Planktomarina sp.]
MQHLQEVAVLDNIYPDVVKGPPRPSVISQPNVFSMPPGTERYVVEGCGAILIPVETGDKITIINDEGGQPCEVIAVDPKGKMAPDIIGGTATGYGRGLKALLMSSDQSLRGLRMGLEARGIDLSVAESVSFFESTTPAKTDVELQVQRDGSVIITAPHPNPNGMMDYEGQDTATPLVVMFLAEGVAPGAALAFLLTGPATNISTFG